ncbi:3-hydroxyacyl-CoA dehydrogenase [Paracoccus liaowanqingii]|uniref:3-hydroxyacyl-CoA dehydrogenase n=1 Tax=Paracoccus liaowanqingii TaxID=2560053 RepID=A0A4P7HNY9_9RHOB|nr:3-hydroxyacyl-CoA dehydrogenase NAD-binding domain-containing protein [Paracoccus liaowanqingii]QBX34951.1 3-hydroxyacyl-CoA dehydrogenase [Paracoccus liaowanqingii]
MQGTKIAILGLGLIGAAWAALFVHHGAQVAAWDPDAAARDGLADRMATPLRQLAQITGHPARGRLEVTGDLPRALDGAVLIQENAPEKPALKHALYVQVEAISDATIASSASGLCWTDLAPGLTNPAQLITAHPFNPPHLVPLVETYGANPARLDRAEAIYRAAGRVPVRLQRPATGHIANRLASALWREAVHLVAEGIADVAAVDAALVHGPGLRWSVMGAHMAYHLGGGPGGMAAYLDHLGPSQERRWADLGAPSLTPQVRAALTAGIAAEADGRDILTLEAARDAALIAVLHARTATGHL